MTTPYSMPSLDPSKNNDIRSLDTPEMIDRLATEMRARCGGELSHSFYVEQVKLQLSGKVARPWPANQPLPQTPKEPASVFHSWAISG